MGWIKKTSLILIFSGFMVLNGWGQEYSQDISIGKGVIFQSKVLGMARPMMIALPARYAQENTRYPVLYVLDGRAHFLHAVATTRFLAQNGRMPAMIVVAIPNVAPGRDHDFTPTHEKERKVSGGAEKFLEYMRTELFPYIENKYRTTSYRVLFGHSLGGMFSLYTLYSHPDMFHSHIAASPYVMYDNNHVLKLISGKERCSFLKERMLFMSLGNEPAYKKGLNRLKMLIKKNAPRSFEWKLIQMIGEGHGSVTLKSLYAGLSFVFSDYPLPENIANGGVKAIKKHYAHINRRYKSEMAIPEVQVNLLGYRLIGKKKYDKAIEMLKFNVELYPESPNVYDSLGDAFSARGDFEAARKNYEIACRKGSEQNSPVLNVYEANLKRVIQQLKDR